MSTATYPVSVIAKLLLLTDRRVTQLVQEGVIPRAERGRYELAPAVQGYIKYLKERAIGADLPGDAAGEHKVRLLKARADIAEMEAERLAGDLAPADDVERAWAAAVGRFRQRSLAIPPKAAPLVAVETEPEACHAIIETFIHEALAELAATDIEIDEPSRGAPAVDDGLQDGGATAETDSEPMGGSLQEA